MWQSLLAGQTWRSTKTSVQMHTLQPPPQNDAPGSGVVRIAFTERREVRFLPVRRRSNRKFSPNRTESIISRTSAHDEEKRLARMCACITLFAGLVTYTTTIIMIMISNIIIIGVVHLIDACAHTTVGEGGEESGSTRVYRKTFG